LDCTPKEREERPYRLLGYDPHPGKAVRDTLHGS
jgi:hypothetical protein